VMSIGKKHKELINRRCLEDELRECSIVNGMKTLKENAKILVLKGITTVEEMVRVSYSNT